MLEPRHRAALVAAHAAGCSLLYPAEGDQGDLLRQQDGQYEEFAQVEAVVRRSVAAAQARVLVLSATGDSAAQYMNYMNVFFTSQKLNIPVDVCMIGQDSGLLQQGSDITGGLYIKVTQLGELLQYLTWLFLPGPTVRKMLGAPPPVKVDYRAACFCHRQLVDVGYVCSVCLSIFCKFNPVCTTCHSVFKAPGLPPMKKKKMVEGGKK